MIVINSVDAQRFSLNGIEYYKNFTPVVAGDTIKIVNTYDSRIEIVPSTNYADFTVDTVTFPNVSLLQSALLPVLFTRDTLGGGGGGVTVFTGLTDTPNSYVGQATKKVVVNGAENALEFVDDTGGSVDEKVISQSIIGQKLQSWLPYGNGFDNVGCSFPSLVGTGANIMSSTGSGDVYSRWNKRRQTSALGLGNSFGIYEQQKRVAYIGNGFYFSAQIATNIILSNRLFIGLSNSTADIADVQISSLTNIIGIGKDSADTNLQLIHNDGAGLATKVDLGVNFVLNPTKFTTIHVELFCEKLTNNVYYRLQKLATTDNTAQDTGWTQITTDLPVNETGLCAKLYGNTGVESGTRLMDINYMNLYV